MRGGDRVWPFWVIDSRCLLGYIGCRFWLFFARFVHICDRYLVPHHGDYDLPSPRPMALNLVYQDHCDGALV
jgi:hypothetical protein